VLIINGGKGSTASYVKFEFGFVALLSSTVALDSTRSDTSIPLPMTRALLGLTRIFGDTTCRLMSALSMALY
jgi:hypothetical protein